MTQKDYYSILEIARDADDTAVKKAYRSLALKWHPDKHIADKQLAEEKFKEINEAYEVLKDSNKRRNYDQFGDPNGQPFSGRRPTGSADHFSFHFGSGDIDDIINNAFFGQGFGHRRPIKNADFSAIMNITLEEAFFGKSTIFEAVDPSGEQKKININIPPGTRNGITLRVEGHGSKQNSQLPPGDLMIRINVMPHDIFTHDNNDLHMKKEISMIDAALGTKIMINVIDGSCINVDIPPGTQSGSTIRVRGKGMYRLNDTTTRGYLFIHIIATTPINLTEEQINILESFRATISQ